MSDYNRFIPFLVPLTLLVLGGCSATSQTTSGRDYLARSPAPQPALETTVSYHSLTNGEVVEETIQRVSTDELVRRAAEIEPLLQLPARIGLARIEAGRLTSLNQNELAQWSPLVEKFAGKGSFVPVDSFLADYTLQAVLPQDARARSGDSNHVLTRIRLGAARQHLDAVLVYEVGVRLSSGDRNQQLPDLSTLGSKLGYSSTVEIEGRARAMLIDVRNGYPYGAASATIDLSEKLSHWPRDTWKGEAKQRAIAIITRNLVPKMDQVFTELVQHMETRVAAKN